MNFAAFFSASSEFCGRSMRIQNPGQSPDPSSPERYGLTDETRDGVMTADTLLQSIAAKASEYGDRELTVPEKNKLTSTHLRASGLIRTALGEARRLEERSGNNDAN